MSGVAALGIWLLAWAPNHQLLTAAITSADRLEHRLVPWHTITEPVLPLWIVWLGAARPGVSGPTGAALYLPGEQWRSFYAITLGRAERLLPHLAVPRLLLAEHHFKAAGGRFKRLERLAPDSAERLLHALITAHVEQRLRLESGFGAELDRRAGALMAAVPPEHRRQAYAGALVEFASHILSIAHEIGRHQRRRQARGETLCAALEVPVSLFGSWRRALEQGEYRGYQPAGDAPVGAEVRSGLRPSTRWVQTEAALQREDKDWMLRLLGISWAGDPARDFAFLCHGS